MKVVFLIGTMQGGGAQRVVTVLGDYFADKDDYNVYIVTTSDRFLEYDLNEKIQFVSFGSTENTKSKKVSVLMELIYFLKKERIDVVFSFLPMTCVYGAVSKLFVRKFKLISSERMDPYQDPKSYFLRKMRDWAYLHSDGLVLQTEDAYSYYRKYGNLKKIIINNPINKCIPEYHKYEKENKIVCVARIDPQKNINMLVDAYAMVAEKHPEYLLYIYGKGIQEKIIKEKIDKLGLSNKIMMKGFVNNIYEEIRNAKMLVLSSDYEGVSNAMLEALCMGIPVVSTDHPIGGAKMFVHDGENGFLSRVGDSNSLAINMCRIIELDEDSYWKMCFEASLTRKIVDPLLVCRQWEEFMIGIMDK